MNLFLTLVVLVSFLLAAEATFGPITLTLSAGAVGLIGLKLVALKAGLIGAYIGSRSGGSSRFGRSATEIQTLILNASLGDSEDCAKKLVRNLEVFTEIKNIRNVFRV